MALFIQQVKRECILHMRQPRLFINACLFFLMLVLFFPLTLKPEVTMLRTMVPGVVWIALLLAMLLASDHVFDSDYEHGVIEQWLVSGYPLSLMVAAKVLVHWVVNILPLLVLCPCIGVLFFLNTHEVGVLALSILAGSPALLFLCALAAVFGVGIQQKGALMALVLLPLTLPLIIFGSGTLTMAMQGFPVGAYLALLLAVSLLAATFLPFAIAAVIRISLVD